MSSWNSRALLCCLSFTLAALTSTANAASWTKLMNQAPFAAGTMFMLTDGSIMVQANYGGAGWMRLTPDATGNYANGIWTATAGYPAINPMSVARLYYGSTILPNGKVLIVGGEYTGSGSDRTDTNTGEIYDPLANSWTPIALYPNQAGCGAATVHSSGNLTIGSNVVTGLEFTGVLVVGWAVTGTGIPGATTISSIDSGTQIHISNNATGGGSQPLTFTGDRTGCLGAVAGELLNNGSFMIGNLLNTSTYQYNPATDMWAFAANKVNAGDSSDEEGWLKLPNGTILNGMDIDFSITQGSGWAEIYDPAGNMWSNLSPGNGSGGTYPLLSSAVLGNELGPSIRLQDGRSLVIGGNNLTALYNPTTNTWAAGPTITGTLSNTSNPGGTAAPFGADDAPGAILPNGHVIFAADAGPAAVTSSGDTAMGSAVIQNIPSTALFQVGWKVTQADGNKDVIPAGTTIASIDSGTQIHISQNALLTVPGKGLIFGGTFSSPAQLFDFNPAGGGSIAPLATPINDAYLNGVGSYVTRMLMLPTGQLLFSDSSNQLYVYTPDGAASPLYKPVINAITYSGTKGVFTLTGKQLNGQSAGSSYGDDVQVDENYPIVRLTSTTGNVYYARTTNWSTLGVATGTAFETVTFTLSQSTPAGNYSVVASGAGIPSVPVALTVTAAELPSPPTAITVLQAGN